MKQTILIVVILIMAGTALAHDDPNDLVSAANPFHFSVSTTGQDTRIVTMTFIISEDEFKARKMPMALLYFKQQVRRIMATNLKLYDKYLASLMSITEKEEATGNN